MGVASRTPLSRALGLGNGVLLVQLTLVMLPWSIRNYSTVYQTSTTSAWSDAADDPIRKQHIFLEVRRHGANPGHGPSRIKVLRFISLVFQPSSHLIWTSKHFPSGYSKGTSPPTNRQTGAREARGLLIREREGMLSTHQGPSHDRSVRSSSSSVFRVYVA
ncbi:hypothetical protein EDB92DRAFT_299538 [Lactarius akahatsu]|uniref:Uncharacterized protein n=1 Tax=Lactarius akahatsu TaxID=416441 RepID=A0AAD4L4T4_9AGAM|nr:hypothetical protein EDB92DRAFT_419967 [Lactarius akahatsu]KAH8980225.1 hypothetical protein EDB92DRAFT_299538 [Lactarius akahatsu]